MNEHNILKNIEKIVKDFKLDATLISATEKQPFDNLIIFIGTDKINRPFVLNITAENQILDPKQDSSIFKVSFRIKLPFKIADFSFSQTSNLIALINHSLELPGFEIDEIENEIFYRYVLLTSDKVLNDEIILGIIGMIKLTLDLHVYSIEIVSSGKMSYDDLLKDALKKSP
jgi:hypothetical protein